MICPKCKIDLPEDSEFCQYCGEKISSPANTPPKQSAPIPQRVIPSPKKTKLKFCSRCGNQIDHDTKVCTGCGKKYFNWAKVFNTKVLNIFILLILTMISILLVLSIVANIVLAVELDEYDSKLRFYEKYIVIVPDDGTNKYHIYGCSRYDETSEFFAFNINAAKGKGYKPCPYCYPYD